MHDRYVFRACTPCSIDLTTIPRRSTANFLRPSSACLFRLKRARAISPVKVKRNLASHLCSKYRVITFALVTRPFRSNETIRHDPGLVVIANYTFPRGVWKLRRRHQTSRRRRNVYRRRMELGTFSRSTCIPPVTRIPSTCEFLAVLSRSANRDARSTS